MKVEIKQDDFQELGFQDLKLMLILRGSEGTTRETIVGEAFTFPLELNFFVPLGNPPSIFIGYTKIKGVAYLSMFHAKNVALHLSARSRTQHTHPIYFIEETLNAMRAILDSINDKDKITLSLPPQQPITYIILKDMKGLDTFLYNLLIKKNMLIVGATNDIIHLIKAIISLLPEEYQQSYSFLINITNRKAKLIGIDPTYCENHTEKIEELLQEGYDIISLDTRHAFGEYTTPLTKHIVSITKEASHIPAVKQAIRTILSTAKEYKENTLSNITLPGGEYTLEPSDHNFLLQVKEAWM